MSQFAGLKGAVIMFDGPDFVGKTTQLRSCQQKLEADGEKVFTSRVNGGSPIGEALRRVLLAKYERPSITDLYIHLAQQYALADELTKHRDKGEVVLIDRSPLSIIAYQVYGSGLDIKRGYQAADEVMKLLKPEVILFYHAPMEILDKRRQKRKRAGLDYFESKPAKYFPKVNRGYELAAKRYQAVSIDASGDIETVSHATMTILSQAAAISL